MQAQRDLRILRRIGRRHLYLDLAETQLFGALAGNIFKVDSFAAQVFERQAVQVVAGGRAVQHIGLQHGVIGDTPQGDMVIGQHAGVVLEVLSHLALAGVLQQGPQLLQRPVAVQLHGRPQVVMRQGHIGGFARLHGKGNANDSRLHVIQAGGLGIEGEQLGLVQAPQPLQEGLPVQNGVAVQLFCSGGGQFFSARQFIDPGLEFQALEPVQQ